MTDPPDTERAPAFDRFFAGEYAGAVRLAHLLTGSNAGAEDLAQDAFARVLPHFERLDNPAAYLRTAVVNACRTWHRTRGREQDRFRRHGATSEVAISAASAELLDSIHRLPYRQQTVPSLAERGLDVAVVTSAVDPGAPSDGTVVAWDPPVGQAAPLGAPITVTVARAG